MTATTTSDSLIVDKSFVFLDTENVALNAAMDEASRARAASLKIVSTNQSQAAARLDKRTVAEFVGTVDSLLKAPV